jgi:putative flavoprotein involved in K+ transport
LVAGTLRIAAAFDQTVRRTPAMSEHDAISTLSTWLSAFDRALSRGDVDDVAALFDVDCYWRDLVAFTWNIITLEGKPAIRDMLEERVTDVRPHSWVIDGPATTAGDVVEAWLAFETGVARGKAYVRLKGGKCWTFLTAMIELIGFEEKQGATREMGVLPPDATDRRTWLERRADEASSLGYDTQPFCLIIGGGQGGLALGARLKRLGVPTLIVDKHKRPGDAWRKRYKSLCLHDPVWYDHMPYLPFPQHWPVFTPKDKLGDWLEMYARVMELNCWNDTECRSAAYDADSACWNVTVRRADKDIILRPAHLILATGMSGVPNMPSIPGMAKFKGEQHHSSAHPGGEAYAGKRAVVVGSNNSAHDICADLLDHGADVTMLQRSSTLVVKTETLLRLSYRKLYSEEAVAAGIVTDKADLMAASIPYKIMPSFQRPIYERIAVEDAAFYERLAAAGFLYDFGEDGSGLSLKYLRRGSGYYIDVGASELIATGAIKLRSDAQISAIGEHGVLLDDGSEIPADLIVYATGYGSMTGWAEQLISREVAEAVGPCWGMGSGTTRDPGPWEGELRNMWKPTKQHGLWFHGGNLAQSRHYSRYLALQMKARYEAIPTAVYVGMESARRNATEPAL